MRIFACLVVVLACSLTSCIGGGEGCCRVCRSGCACGDSCISCSSTCRVGGGCACFGTNDGSEDDGVWLWEGDDPESSMLLQEE